MTIPRKAEEDNVAPEKESYRNLKGNDDDDDDDDLRSHTCSVPHLDPVYGIYLEYKIWVTIQLRFK